MEEVWGSCCWASVGVRVGIEIRMDGGERRERVKVKKREKEKRRVKNEGNKKVENNGR